MDIFDLLGWMLCQLRSRPAAPPPYPGTSLSEQVHLPDTHCSQPASGDASSPHLVPPPQPEPKACLRPPPLGGMGGCS